MTSAEIDALWDFSDPAATEVRFREALIHAESPEIRAEISTQIARTLGLQRRFDEAQQVLDALDPEATSPRVAVRRLLEQGRVLNSSGRKQEAIAPFQLALDLAAKEPGMDYYAVDAAHMLGIATEGSASLEWNLRAIDMAKASPDPRAQKWLGSLLNNTAWSLHDLGRLEEAHAMFVDALAFREQHGTEETIRIAKWSVARALRSLGRFDNALAIQNELAAAGHDDGYVAEELGELWLAKGEPERAKPYFQAAFAKLSQDPWLSANEPDRLARLKSLGE
ncbi:MAG: tetratricopeptide repeat protein [Fimbriimonadaceae bacterium]|nr:tetratricopeptide repeat protein [Fimbriimonadaceae bacterium]